jgi:hypothetical protein
MGTAGEKNSFHKYLSDKTGKYLKKGHKLLTKDTKTSETFYVEQLFPLLN